ncbi:zinc dependent phospholipase C family protein [Faecalibaculum rodentium]|uniref:zinc dependent phospholipase C family protein n=1 Tax=Faecalibaculum rodentium TaxID=1702221 RepID=UPI0023EFB6EE|nr:zinc dependent phospholipase C family protein [Faecalibaculum rodentium]
MPNLITHALLAQEAAGRMPADIQSLLESRAHLVGIGSSGPDFLFFQGLNPVSFWKPARIRQYGGRFHHSHINEFYLSALESIRREKNPEIRLDMEAYVCGHLCHWALDSTAHPYIYARTGDGTTDSSTRHHTMESLIDAIMLKIKRDQTIREFHFPSIADTSREEKRAIARIYVPAIAQIFQDDIQPHLIADSLDDWHSMQKRFYDAGGGKKQTLKTMEKWLGKENLISGLVVPAQIEDNWDVMNLQHRRWTHPCDGTLTFTDSFLDLYDKAVEKAVTAMSLFMDAVNDPAADHAFLAFLDDRGYDTNMTTDCPMVNFDIIDFKY